MKIVVYTVADCKYSAEEKTYLQSHNLPFEEHDVEKDHAALETMLKVGNNFAGTPVTQVTKDDGQELILKGFTAEEFDEALGFAKKPEVAPAPADAAAATATTATVTTDPTQPATPAATEQVATPAVGTPPPAVSLPDLNQAPVAPAPAVPAPSSPVMQTESTPATAPNPLDNILKDLQTQLGDAPAAPQAPATPPPATPQPQVAQASQSAVPPQPVPPAMPVAPVAAAPVAPPTPVVPDFPKV